MRIPDNIVTAPVIIIGWVLAVVVIISLIRITPRSNNKELAQMGTVGAYIFVISIIQLPLLPIPIGFSLSGVTLALLLFGMRRGALVATAAIILNHLVIPGALGALGLNLTNMLAIAMLIGFIAHKVIEINKASRRLRYMIAFSVGLGYIIIEGIIILSELAVMHTTDAELQGVFLVFLGYLALLGILEGFFTAISYSYYSRGTGSTYARELIDEMRLDTSKAEHEVELEFEEDD